MTPICLCVVLKWEMSDKGVHAKRARHFLRRHALSASSTTFFSGAAPAVAKLIRRLAHLAVSCVAHLLRALAGRGPASVFRLHSPTSASLGNDLRLSMQTATETFDSPPPHTHRRRSRVAKLSFTLQPCGFFGESAVPLGSWLFSAAANFQSVREP